MTIPKLPLSLFRNILPGSSSAIRSLTTRAAGEDVRTAKLIQYYKMAAGLKKDLADLTITAAKETETILFHLNEGDITQAQANQELKAIEQQRIKAANAAITAYTRNIIGLDPAFNNIEPLPPEETAAAAPTTTIPMPANLENMPTAAINLTGYNFGDTDDTPPVSASGVTIEHVGGSESFF